MATLEEVLDKAIDVAVKRSILNAHPVGSLYISLTADNPKDLLGGEWENVGSGRCLWGADSDHAAGATIAAGLPNITGTNHPYGIEGAYSAYSVYDGAFYLSESTGATNGYGHTVNSANAAKEIKFDASRSNAIYGASDTVQPPALAVNIWKRTA